MQILKQRFNYAKIELIRDNCLVDIGKVKEYIDLTPVESSSSKSDDFFGDLLADDDEDSNKFEIRPVIKITNIETIKLEPFPKKGAKTKYFYIDSPEKEYIGFLKSTKKPFYTTKERHIKRHYANPFASIEVFTYERTIELRDNKLFIRAYKQRRWRDFNWKYFRKNHKIETFSIDLNKGDFIIGEISRNSNMKTNRFRKNSFTTLENLLCSSQFFNKTQVLPKTEIINNDFEKSFNDEEFLSVLLQYIPNIPLKQDDVTDRNLFLKSFIDFFVTKKKIKVPNEYVGLIRRYYPTEKFLKKNDRKLVQSILDSFGVNSKLTVKILHENIDINIQDFACFCSLFGKDFTKYIGTMTPESLKIFINKDAHYHGNFPLEMRGVKNSRLFIDNVEKENIIKIVNSLNDKLVGRWGGVNNIYGLFKDHFEMIEKLREYDPTIKMRATTYEDFHVEHSELSKMVSLIKKGWTVEYQFDNRMVRLVEEPMTFVGEDLVTRTFKPQILKREEDYTEEGSFMHHCVATYANKESSIIISLRTDNNADRVTCEFIKKSGECVQERHFCNRIPPKHFEEPLKILRDRVKKFAHQRLLNHIDVKKVKVKINGKEVEPEERTGFDELLMDAMNRIQF